MWGIEEDMGFLKKIKLENNFGSTLSKNKPNFKAFTEKSSLKRLASLVASTVLVGVIGTAVFAIPALLFVAVYGLPLMAVSGSLTISGVAGLGMAGIHRYATKDERVSLKIAKKMKKVAKLTYKAMNSDDVESKNKLLDRAEKIQLKSQAMATKLEAKNSKLYDKLVNLESKNKQLGWRYKKGDTKYFLNEQVLKRFNNYKNYIERIKDGEKLENEAKNSKNTSFSDLKEKRKLFVQAEQAKFANEMYNDPAIKDKTASKSKTFYDTFGTQIKSKISALQSDAGKILEKMHGLDSKSNEYKKSEIEYKKNIKFANELQGAWDKGSINVTNNNFERIVQSASQNKSSAQTTNQKVVTEGMNGTENNQTVNNSNNIKVINQQDDETKEKRKGTNYTENKDNLDKTNNFKFVDQHNNPKSINVAKDTNITKRDNNELLKKLSNIDLSKNIYPKNATISFQELKQCYNDKKTHDKIEVMQKLYNQTLIQFRETQKYLNSQGANINKHTGHMYIKLDFGNPNFSIEEKTADLQLGNAYPLFYAEFAKKCFEFNLCDECRLSTFSFDLKTRDYVYLSDLSQYCNNLNDSKLMSNKISSAFCKNITELHQAFYADKNEKTLNDSTINILKNVLDNSKLTENKSQNVKTSSKYIYYLLKTQVKSNYQLTTSIDKDLKEKFFKNQFDRQIDNEKTQELI